MSVFLCRISSANFFIKLIALDDRGIEEVGIALDVVDTLKENA